jgi:hypothetical protein
VKDRGLATVITAERGDTTLTRNGVEEYVSDCVIVLDHRVIEQLSTRRLRVLKYRGSAHGTNEYPFLIGDEGFTVLPDLSRSRPDRLNRARVEWYVRSRQHARRQRFLTGVKYSPWQWGRHGEDEHRSAFHRGRRYSGRTLRLFFV